MNQPRCYSVLRLAPFLGTTQVIELDQARALSTDGVHWRIQVRQQISGTQWGSLDTGDDYVRYVVYAIWDAQEGLQRVPVNPAYEITQLQVHAQTLLPCLQAIPQPLPFPRADHRELWMLDDDTQQPLALLASAVHEVEQQSYRDASWVPMLRGAREFIAPSLADQQSDQIQRPHQDHLIDAVQRRAGRPARAQWFLRNQQGVGTGLGGLRIEDALQGRVLAAQDFPESLLSREWQDTKSKILIEEYLGWLAAQLLTLPLQAATRAYYEGHAKDNALEVFALYRLYPEIHDQDAMDALLVQARLMSAS